MIERYLESQNKGFSQYSGVISKYHLCNSKLTLCLDTRNKEKN